MIKKKVDLEEYNLIKNGHKTIFIETLKSSRFKNARNPIGKVFSMWKDKIQITDNPYEIYDLKIPYPLDSFLEITSKGMPSIIVQITEIYTDKIKEIFNYNIIDSGIIRTVDNAGKSWYSTYLDTDAKYDTPEQPFMIYWNNKHSDAELSYFNNINVILYRFKVKEENL